MAALSTIFAATAAGLAVTGAVQQAGAINAQAQYGSRMTDINLRRTEMQKKDALRRGVEDSNDYRKSVKKLSGSQKVGYAGQGVDISSGSAADVMNETIELGEKDAQRIETNAFREALGFEMQKSDYEANRIMNNSSAQTQRTATLLGGGLNALSYGADFFGKEKK